MQEMTTVDPLAVAIEGVSHCYRRQQALDDVTSITPSTFVVLLGLNGAGKSTLMSLITRLYAIQRGISGFSAAMSDMRRARLCAWSASLSCSLARLRWSADARLCSWSARASRTILREDFLRVAESLEAAHERLVCRHGRRH
jgi:energy-coupling factor transporter ATP-binding protein EcfA2